MRIEGEAQDYLLGKKFFSAVKIPISTKEKNVRDRLSFLENLVKDKKVLHIGCCDHHELIRDKIAKDIWLHARLCCKTKRCLGIDINRDAVRYLHDQLQYKDIICADLIKDRIEEIFSEKWDYMILGELLEHLDNPLLFLSSIRNIYSKCVDKVVITVPNAFSIHNFIQASRHKELINSDHKYWFTPYTLAKIATLAGFQIEEFYFCTSCPPMATSFYEISFRNFFLKNFPAFRDSLLMILY